MEGDIFCAVCKFCKQRFMVDLHELCEEDMKGTLAIECQDSKGNHKTIGALTVPEPKDL